MNRGCYKSIKLACCVLYLLLVQQVVAGSQPEHTVSNYVLATATPGGTFYPVGVAIATLITAKLQKTSAIRMTAISTAGSDENLKLLASGKVQFAILQGYFAATAWYGKPPAGQHGRQRHLRSLTRLWDNVEHFTIRSDSDEPLNITALKSLNGMNFSLGERNSGSLRSGQYILDKLGIDPARTFRQVYLGYGKSAEALLRGQIAGMNTPGGVPVNAVRKVFEHAADELQILNFTAEQIDKVNREFNLWSRHRLDKSAYPGMRRNVETMAQPNVLVVHKDVEPAVVEKILDTLYANLDYLARVHTATHSMKLQHALDGMIIPLHPGAVRFYGKQGIPVPDNLKPGQ